MTEMTMAEVNRLAEEDRVRRLTITFEQLEKFEEAIEIAKKEPCPPDIDPSIRVAEIEAMISVAVDLRKEATNLAHGRYICTKRNPWDKAVHAHAGRGCHPAAEDDGECSDGCCDDYRCPYCGVHWRVEHGA